MSGMKSFLRHVLMLAQPSLLRRGEPSSISVVPDIGDGLHLQVFKGDVKAAHITSSLKLLSELDLFELGIQPIEAEGLAGPLCIADGEGTLLSPLCSFPPPLLGEPGYSDWVVKCAMKIFPIVGISL